MHKVIAYIFTILYLIAMVRPAQPVINYVLNFDYIVNELCINKDEPKLNCNGKCYLMQLIDNQQSQNPFDDKAIQMDLYPIGFVAFLSITFERTTSFNKSETFTPTTIYDFLEIYSLDKPPQHIS